MVVAVTGTAHAADVCLVTDGDILGPFYRPNAKNTTKMVDASTEGERIVLTGTVLRPDCQTPVAGATVDFWHCDHNGAYDIKTPDEKIAPENYRFRAITQTDKEGRFVFETIVPGRYGIPSQPGRLRAIRRPDSARALPYHDHPPGLPAAHDTGLLQG